MDRPPRKNMLNLLVPVLLLLVLVAGIGALIWWGRADRPDRFALMQVSGAERHGFLLVQRRGVGANARLFRAVLVDRRGQARGIVRLLDAARVLGVQGGRAWIEGGEGIRVYQLPDLALVADLGPSISQHGILSRGYQVSGLTPQDQIVLRGRDDRYYEVGADGAVTRREERARTAPSPVRLRDAAQTGLAPPLPLEGDPSVASSAPLAVANLDLVQPGVMVRPDGTAEAFTNPPGYLVLSQDIRGSQGVEQLSRVSPEGTIAWTTTAAQMAAPDAAGRFLLSWAGISDGSVWVVGESRVRTSNRETQSLRAEPQIVQLSVDSGAVTARIPITIP